MKSFLDTMAEQALLHKSSSGLSYKPNSRVNYQRVLETKPLEGDLEICTLCLHMYVVFLETHL